MRLEAIFNPGSVAIIGASRTPGKVGHVLTKNILESGFDGEIYPVNPNADKILGLTCYKSVLDIPQKVELAVVAIPAKFVNDVAEECGEKGVDALIVISAGFKETGQEGAKLEQKLVEIANKYEMKLQGPNCLGLINTSIPLNLSFAEGMPKKGRIGFISQSGALGTAVLDWILQQEIGFHSFISLGNKADLDENDFIEAMFENKSVSVILLYLESIEEGRKFMDVALRVTEEKPIIVLKGGKSQAGARAAGSHTGALVGSFLAYQKAFDKSGVILAESVEELFNYGLTFTQQPVPREKGVAIVTNAGGPGILATDLIEELSLHMADLSRDTINNLRENLPPAAATGNPVDVLGDAKADRYAFAIREVLKDESVNSLFVLLTPQAMTEPRETADAIIELNEEMRSKPIVTVFMGGEMVESSCELLRDNDIPCFNFPEDAIRTLSALYKYSRYIKRPAQPPAHFEDVDKKSVAKVFNKVRDDNRVVLLDYETADVMDAYGIPISKRKLAKTPEEAVDQAREIGYPVVLKISSPDILHKTDVGGIELDLKSDEEVKATFNNILTRVQSFMPQANIMGITVCDMVPEGREMIIGMSRDVQFGPLIMFGLGGIYVNFLEDVSFRLAPLSEGEAQEMMEDTKAYTLLKGIRGEPPSDIDCLRETLLRVGQLVTDFPRIAEMDINPIFVYEAGEGCTALDVKITLTRE
ncbi:MAG: acetate--CoA ligase alpha subunit [Candidatus Bathyarchaeia archaeon]